jgi:hypothetical protein
MNLPAETCLFGLGGLARPGHEAHKLLFG